MFQPAAQPRLWFLDNLKVALMGLVILHHVGQAYGPTGGFWYFQNPERWPYLGLFFWTNASFFMGLYFFISAYFLPGAFDRKGAGKLIKDRLLRFGVPLLGFVLLVNPVMMYLSFRHFRGGTLGFMDYLPQVYLGLGPKPAGLTGGMWPDLNFGHLWFVEHLLVYALCYAAWRVVFKRPGAPARQVAAAASAVAAAPSAPGDLAILGYALGLTAVSMLVRIWFPIDRWIGFLGFIQMEPGHLPQYLSMFILGTVAYRQGWLSALPAARGMRWLWTGVAAVCVAVVVRSTDLPENVRAVIFAMAESFVAVGLSVGLCTLFRERWNGTSRLWQTLSADAFGAYLIHFPVVVAVQYAVAAVPAGPLIKFLMAGAASIVGSFAASHLLRKLPGATAIL